MSRQNTQQRWRTRETVILDGSVETSIKPDRVSVYGGWQDRRTRATGFFRVERDPDQRWWLIDPAGHPFVSMGVNSVRPNNTRRGREQMAAIWGDSEAWAAHALELLRANAFNSIGSWSSVDTLRSRKAPLPYTVLLNFMGGYSRQTRQSTQGVGHRNYPDGLIPVFDPAFEAYCHQEARKLRQAKDDPWLIGYFSDNELPFRADALDTFLRRPETDPGHVAALAWLEEQQIKHEAIDDGARASFLQFMADRYFRISREAIRANDPNHLYLGARFHGRTLRMEPVVSAAGKHVDVISFNVYNRWSLAPTQMDAWMAWADRPFLISEFYAKAMDTGLPNTTGAGWVVETQADRGAFYQNFVMPLIRHPGCVGWHWHRYLDNDPADTEAEPSNIDSNKGIVTIRFEPYTELLSMMSRINRRAHQLRATGNP